MSEKFWEKIELVAYILIRPSVKNTLQNMKTKVVKKVINIKFHRQM